MDLHTDLPRHIVDQIVDARRRRNISSAVIAGGSCDLKFLAEYKDALVLSMMLGDLSSEEAQDYLDRAREALACNVATLRTLGGTRAPPNITYINGE